MKHKGNVTYKARLNGREQVDEHYDSETKVAPVVNEIIIHAVFVLIAMATWHAELLDKKGAFLHG
jgi:hypothetical protein